MKLEGQACIVTGGASGIGRAAAIALAAEGAQLVVSDCDVPQGQETVETILGAGGVARFVECDVSDEAQAKDLIAATASAYGRLDVLFNNAGINPMEGSVVDMPLETWRRVFGVNVDGMFYCSRHAIPEMRKAGGGRIINTASPSSYIGWPDNAAYIASKGAVMSLTRAMALDHARENIRVNAIVPGLIMTGIGRHFLAAQDDPGAVTDAIPLGRAGQPSDIAPLVVFLAGEDANFSTGAPFFADGGQLAT